MKITIKNADVKGFIYVYVNGKYYGMCMTDGTVTSKEAYNAVKANYETDLLERTENARINRSLNY